MALVTINGSELYVAKGTRPTTPLKIGDNGRALDGALRTTVRAEKLRWAIVTAEKTYAEAAALRAIIVEPNRFTVAGTMIGGTYTCQAVIEDDDPVEDGVNVVMRFRLEEV